jgi:hypothetical protein
LHLKPVQVQGSGGFGSARRIVGRRGIGSRSHFFHWHNDIAAARFGYKIGTLKLKTTGTESYRLFSVKMIWQRQKDR